MSWYTKFEIHVKKEKRMCIMDFWHLFCRYVDSEARKEINSCCQFPYFLLQYLDLVQSLFSHSRHNGHFILFRVTKMTLSVSPVFGSTPKLARTRIVQNYFRQHKMSLCKSNQLLLAFFPLAQANAPNSMAIYHRLCICCRKLRGNFFT